MKKLIIIILMIFLASMIYFGFFVGQNWGKLKEKFFHASSNDIVMSKDEESQARRKCTNDGGEITSQSDKNGYYKVCHFPNGGECEAMSYLNSGCNSSDAANYQESSKQIAHEWIRYNSSTFLFDGFDLVFKDVRTLRCPYCYQFNFAFISPYSGYGDRSGDKLTEQATEHTASVYIEKGVIDKVVLDGKINEYEPKDIGEKKTEAIYGKIKPNAFIFGTGASGNGWLKIGSAGDNIYFRILIDKITLPPDKKSVNAWLVSEKDDKKYLPIGRLNYDPSGNNYKKDLILPANKEEFNIVLVSFETDESVKTPSSIIASSSYNKIEEISIE